MPQRPSQALPTRAVPAGHVTTHGRSRQVGNPTGGRTGTTPAVPSVVPTSATVTWNPLARQVVEPDTLYLLDPDGERTLTPGVAGGLQFGPGYAPDAPFSAVTTPSGKYRKALRGSTPSGQHGNAWMPCMGIINPNEFTIETWLFADTDWSAVVREVPVSLVGSSAFIKVVVASGALLVLAGASDSSVLLSYTIPAGAYAANTPYSVAATLIGGVATLYVGGTQVAQTTGNAPIAPIRDLAGIDGLFFKGYYRGVESNGHVWLSDLRLSARARTPGVPLTVTNATTITVTPGSLTGTNVNLNLTGELFGPIQPGGDQARAAGVVTAKRYDHLIDRTPMKAGAIDTAHPTPGHSGAYSYDWSVVADPVASYCTLHGLRLHLSLDYTPSLLGGAQPPPNGGENGTPPNDYNAFATICADLIYHMYNDIGLTDITVGLWNEPDGSYWTGTLGDPTVAPASQVANTYLGLYAKVATAIKGVNAAIPFGGPETTSWINPLIDFCAAFSVPLDFISYHDYSADISQPAAMRARIDARRATHGLPAGIPIIIGEFNWQLANLGASQWGTYAYFRNDYSAALLAQTLMAYQAAGCSRFYYTFGSGADTDTGFGIMQLQTTAHAWSNFNVYRLWSQLAPSLVTATQAAGGRPDISCQASTDSAGRVTVLLAQRRYRKDNDTPIVLTFAGWTPTAVAVQVIDDGHSNYFDTNGATDGLQQAASPAIVAGTVTVVLRPRSVVLLTLIGH